jgi:predicted unusual protein kinase regulating ubiquinone biosynthesis (AarF/ABC1/UbiB family)
MEKNVIPQAYASEFAQAQFSVPPLSAPLVVKTFRKYLGKSPLEIFDAFDTNSYRAASMGQVHRAKLGDVNLAVKIQYPGVAESISSDLALVKPFALKMFNIKGKDSEKFFKEVEDKLIEETDYDLELKRSLFISEKSKHFPNLEFPRYFKELSGSKILTMSWLDGIHLSEFTKENKNQDLANELGQTLWDFYMFQMHDLKQVQADPHPGNFLITKDNKLGVIDFGCIKELPQSFYTSYFDMTKKEILDDPVLFEKGLKSLEMIREDDSLEAQTFFKEMFYQMLSMLSLPFHEATFDFSSVGFLSDLASLGEKYGKSDDIRKFNGNRGVQHLLYMNRTFFGLYNLLHDLKATVRVNDYKTIK